MLQPTQWRPKTIPQKTFYSSVNICDDDDASAAKRMRNINGDIVHCKDTTTTTTSSSSSSTVNEWKSATKHTWEEWLIRLRSKVILSSHSSIQHIEKKRRHPMLQRSTMKAPWFEYSTQALAFECADRCAIDSHVFSYECESLGCGGKRRFVVTTYAEFWRRYSMMSPEQQHYYEVIREKRPCKLYMDLEYTISLNGPDERHGLLSDDATIEVLIKFLCRQLAKCFPNIFSAPMSVDDVVHLDSSTSDKFSRHLIFNGSAVFHDNAHLAYFMDVYVKRPLVKARQDYSFDDVQMTETELSSLFIVTKASSSQHCSSNSKSSSANFAASLMMIDFSVYTRNRNFRLWRSSKLGKSVALVKATANTFHIKNRPIALLAPNGYAPIAARSSAPLSSTEYEVCGGFTRAFFIASLVCAVVEGTHVLECNSMDSPILGRKSGLRSSNCDNGTAINNRCKTTASSPYPLVDKFIHSLANLNGVAGWIRKWVFFEEGKYLYYDIAGNRYCRTKKSYHSSNNVTFVVNLCDGIWYQKCYSPKCQSLIRPGPFPLPSALNPFLSFDRLPGTLVGDNTLSIPAAEPSSDYENDVYDEFDDIDNEALMFALLALHEDEANDTSNTVPHSSPSAPAVSDNTNISTNDDWDSDDCTIDDSVFSLIPVPSLHISVKQDSDEHVTYSPWSDNGVSDAAIIKATSVEVSSTVDVIGVFGSQTWSDDGISGSDILAKATNVAKPCISSMFSPTEVAHRAITSATVTPIMLDTSTTDVIPKAIAQSEDFNVDVDVEDDWSDNDDSLRQVIVEYELHHN